MKTEKISAMPLLILIWSSVAFFLAFELIQLIRPLDFMSAGSLAMFFNPMFSGFLVITLLIFAHLKSGYRLLVRIFFMTALIASVLYPLLIFSNIKLSWYFCLGVFFFFWFVAGSGLWLCENGYRKLLAVWSSALACLLLYLYLDRLFYLFFRVHLNFMHLWRLKNTAVQDANLNLSNIAPYIVDILAFCLLSYLIFLVKRPLGNYLQRKVLLSVLFQFLLLLFHFNFIIESRPFSEYLIFRFDAAGIELPLPDSLKPLQEANLVLSDFRLEPELFFTGAKFSWNSKERKNLIFITLESVRAHEIEKTMPLLMNWVKKGIYFKRHFSASNLTETAINSIYSSIYPFYLTTHLHKMNDWVFTDFLKNHGYKLFKVYSKWTGVDSKYKNFSMITIPEANDDEPEMKKQPLEWFVKISDYQLQKLANSCGDILKKVIEIATKNERFFIEGYPFNAHFNYNYPEKFAIHQPTLPERFMIHHLDPDPENIKKLENRYKNALAYTDYCLNEFLKEFYQKKLDKNTVLVLYGDHGQSLGEAGFLAHVSGPHITQFQVPLLIIGAGVTPQTYPYISQHLDILPTLAPILGYSCTGVFGKNLFKENRSVSIEQENSTYNRFIVRRDKIMSIYDITADYRVRWVITIGNNFEMTPALLQAYSQPGLEQLKQVISDDFAQIKRECRIK